MRIPSFHLVLTLIVGGVVLAGCGNGRPEKTQRTSREGKTAKTGKTDAEPDKTDGKTEDGKTAKPKTPEANKTAAENGAGKATAQATNGKETNGKQATGQEATDKKATSKQANGKQANGKQANGKQANGKQATAAKAENADAPLRASHQRLILPTGDRNSSLLAVETFAPKKHQTGRDYKYEIHVTNLSSPAKDNVALDNVRVTQRIQGKVPALEQKVSIKGKDGKEVKDRAPKFKSPADDDPSAVWTFALLEAGDHAVITVTAKAPEKGKLSSSLGAEFNPLLRLETEIADSPVRLAKTGPEKPVTNSRNIEYTYVLKNEGKEPVTNLTVTDKLADGLKTAEGKDTVTLQCDRLDGGGKKEWKVTVKAPKAGTYESQAVVTWPGATSARSSEKLSVWEQTSDPVATEVLLGSLKVAVKPDQSTQYQGQKLTYEVTVENTGTAKVEGAKLVAMLDKAAKLADDAASKDNTWSLPAIDPKKTAPPIRIIVTSDAPGKLESKFEASFVCDGEKMTGVDSVTTDIKALDVIVEATPSQAQLQEGESFICLVQLRNEGKNRVSGLNLSLRLPEIASYEGMEGNSDAKFDEETRTVALPAIEQLDPRDKPRTLRVRVKAEKAGKGVFTVNLMSEALGATPLSFQSEGVTVAAKKSAAKAPLDAPPAKPNSTTGKAEKAKDQEKPKAKPGEKSEEEKAQPAKKE